LILYVDSSILVSALTAEAASPRVQLWLEMQKPDSLRVSLWVETELSSALSLKVRTGASTPALRKFCLSGFAALKDESLTVAPIKPKHFVSATRLVDASLLGLRAADALHLAVSMDIGAALCMLDVKFAQCAAALGAKVNLLTPAP
jgi:uncharacterized protein